MLRRACIRLTAGIVVLAGVLLTSGCMLPLPSRPLEHGPVSITVLDDRISMVQCLVEDIDVHYVAVSLREQDGKRREWPLLTAEGDRRQEVSIPSGVAVDLRTAFQGLPVVDENDIRVSSLSGDVTVYLVLAASDQRIEMAFRNIEASSLVEGAYIYYSGEVSTQACGMKRGYV